MLAAQPILLHPRAEGGEGGGFLLAAALGVKCLQPVHIAAELAQPEDVLEVDPEMPSAFREGGDVVRPDNHGPRCHPSLPMYGMIVRCVVPGDGALRGEHGFKLLKPLVNLR